MGRHIDCDRVALKLMALPTQKGNRWGGGGGGGNTCEVHFYALMRFRIALGFVWLGGRHKPASL